MKVITYQLAYPMPYYTPEVSLCPACVERGDHDCGALGRVQHGLHSGTCQGAKHAKPRRAKAKPEAM